MLRKKQDATPNFTATKILMTRTTEKNGIHRSATKKTTVHTSRTIMLHELTRLLSLSSIDTERTEYRKMIVEDNVLNKPTLNTRKLTAKRLFELYGFEFKNLHFRAMRKFWQVDPDGRPLLAMLAACTRDTLLKTSLKLVLDMPCGTIITSSDMEHYIEENMPGRFGPKTLRSVSQNLNSSLTQAGYLSGKVNKRRVQVRATPGNTTYALFLAYLEGNRSERLFESPWAGYLDCSAQTVQDLCIAASRRGWLDYLNAGGVIEIRFPNLLTNDIQEEHK